MCYTNVFVIHRCSTLSAGGAYLGRTHNFFSETKSRGLGIVLFFLENFESTLFGNTNFTREISKTMTTAEMDASVCKDAEQFTKLFYEALDKRRNQVSRMYTSGACMVWNGTALAGQESINTFLIGLPSSEHTVKCVDAQAISAQVSGNVKSIMIQAAGTVRYGGRDRMFTQTFILSQENELLKISSDRFRFLE